MEKWYVYSLFVFLLGCVWLFLFLKYLPSKRHPDIIKKLKEREDKLFKLYQNIEDMMDSFEEYVSEIKEELYNQINYSSEIFKQETNSIKEIIEKGKVSLVNSGDMEGVIYEEGISNQSRASKIGKVNLLIDQGYSIDDIAKELDMGIGEVKLIYQIKKKNKSKV